MPDTLYATYSNLSGACNCLSGLISTLAWDGNSQKWLWSATNPCDITKVMETQLYCDASWELYQASGGGTFGTKVATSYVCSPLSVVFDYTGDHPVCTGDTVRVTITQ